MNFYARYRRKRELQTLWVFLFAFLFVEILIEIGMTMFVVAAVILRLDAITLQLFSGLVSAYGEEFVIVLLMIPQLLLALFVLAIMVMALVFKQKHEVSYV